MKYSAKRMKVEDKTNPFNYVPAFVFLIFIFGLGIWFIFNPKIDYSSSEKRYLQEFPEVSVENVASGKFGEDFESYFADHFPSRNVWVGMNAYYNLNIGNNGASGVYNCDNGYLINKPVPTENRVENNLNAIVKFKNNTDIPVTVMFAPSTGYVCDDVLPRFHDVYNDDVYFENAIKKLSQNDISFVDLRDTFKKEYKNGGQLYFKTDHHWTTLGAYTAYAEYCKSMGLNAKPKDNFTVNTYNDFYGTTYSTSGFWLTEPDNIEVWNNPDNTAENISVKITEGTKNEAYDSMYFYDHLNEDDKYPVFIDGNHALTEITNSKAQGGTLVMVKDSFSHCIAPFLAENYSKIILVDMRYYKNDISKLAKEENAEQILVMYGIDNFATDTDIVWLK